MITIEAKLKLTEGLQRVAENINIELARQRSLRQQALE
jgi:hypothetical protein